jgi:hypothetical protein
MGPSRQLINLRFNSRGLRRRLAIASFIFPLAGFEGALSNPSVPLVAIECEPGIYRVHLRPL